MQTYKAAVGRLFNLQDSPNFTNRKRVGKNNLQDFPNLASRRRAGKNKSPPAGQGDKNGIIKIRNSENLGKFQ